MRLAACATAIGASEEQRALRSRFTGPAGSFQWEELVGLAAGDALPAGRLERCFFAFPDELFEVLVVCFRVLRAGVLVLVSEVDVVPLINESFPSWLAYGLASGLVFVKVPPPADGALAAGPLPVPDCPPPVPPLEPPVLPVCACAMT